MPEQLLEMISETNEVIGWCFFPKIVGEWKPGNQNLQNQIYWGE